MQVFNDAKKTKNLLQLHQFNKSLWCSIISHLKLNFHSLWFIWSFCLLIFKYFWLSIFCILYIDNCFFRIFCKTTFSSFFVCLSIFYLSEKIYSRFEINTSRRISTPSKIMHLSWLLAARELLAFKLCKPLCLTHLTDTPYLRGLFACLAHVTYAPYLW